MPAKKPPQNRTDRKVAASRKDPAPAKSNKKPKTPMRELLDRRKREATVARFIYYPGQKGTIIERIATLIPKTATRLIEPFTGSASVPAALAFRFREIKCSDTLPAVIEAHCRAIADPEGFSADIHALFDDPMSDPEARFNELRETYNSSRTPLKTKAALLIYLNRKAALGLVRHNEEGRFSGSWHKSKIDNSPPLAAIRQFSRRLRGKAKFALRDFRDALNEAGPGDFVYCDPPYLPEEGKTTTFTGYSDQFGVKDHIDLAALARAAADRGAKVVISNHDSVFIRQTYASADSFTALDVERRAGRKKGEKAKTSAGEILAVWRPRKRPGNTLQSTTTHGAVVSPVQVVGTSYDPIPPPGGQKRLRRESAIDPYGRHADQPTLDRRAFELAKANGWLRKGADPARIGFRSFSESGGYLLKIARSGTPSMRRLVLDWPGRETCVSLHLLARICDAISAGSAPRREAEAGARTMLALADGFVKHLAGIPGAEVLVERALKHKAAVVIDGRLETARLPERYQAILETVATRGWRRGSETEHRLLLLAELCADADTKDFRALCRKLAKAPGPAAFLEAFPALKAGRSHGVPLQAHVALSAGAVAEIIEKMG